MDGGLLEQFRYFLKDSIRKRIDFSQTDQNKGIQAPPIEKPYASDGVRLDLVKPGDWKSIPGIDLASAIRNRQSRRAYAKEPLNLEELSFLLWATQGVRGKVGRRPRLEDGAIGRVPSRPGDLSGRAQRGGARRRYIPLLADLPPIAASSSRSSTSPRGLSRLRWGSLSRGEPR